MQYYLSVLPIYTFFRDEFVIVLATGILIDRNLFFLDICNIIMYNYIYTLI